MKNPIIKVVAYSLIGIVVLWILQAIVSGAGYGFGMNYGGNYIHHYGRGTNMYGSMYSGSSITYLLTTFIKILSALFVISLLAGLAVWAKNSLFSAEEKEAIKNTFAFKPVNRVICTKCSRELNGDWKVCPYCGREKEAENNA